MSEQKKQKTGDHVEGEHRSSVQQTLEEHKALAIIEQKENLPKELWNIIENYQRYQTKPGHGPSDFLEAFENRLIVLLVKDIYREGFEWCPQRIQTAMALFPEVLPYAFRDGTDQYIQDKAKMVSVYAKKDELPCQLQEVIDGFEGDFVQSTSTVPRQFLEDMNKKMRRYFQFEDERSEDWYDPHKLETALRFFPQVMMRNRFITSFVHVSGFNGDDYNPKTYPLIPILLQIGDDLGMFSCSNNSSPMNGVLRRLLNDITNCDPKRSALVEEACISIVEDIMERKLISKEQIVERKFALGFSFLQWCFDGMGSVVSYENKWYDKRFRFLVKLVPVESRERYYEQVVESPCYSPCEFRRYLDACLYWFPTEMGRLFLGEKNRFSNSYHVKMSQCDPIVFELLEVHLAEATQQTRIDLITYVASNDLVPRKFLYFIVRRELFANGERI